jgi:cell wall-associated NlpC family hydrolase
MPIKRLTAFTVLAAALLAVAPVQADTSKTHGKPANAKHAQQKQPPHSKPAHGKPAHSNSKLAAATHKGIRSRSAASSTGDADVAVSTMGDDAAVETKSQKLPIWVSRHAGSLQASPLQAASFTVVDSAVATVATPAWLSQAPASDQAQMLVQTTEPTYFGRLGASDVVTGDESVATDHVPANTSTGLAGTEKQEAEVAGAGEIGDLRKALIAMAMGLRDIRYVRGGHDPATGFDCSGFVRYVFAHAIGMQLPTNSASQFLAGLKVKREDMKPGDLVFFHTRGKRGISHVGIYISNGNFIHSPASGESVQISSLDDAYWAKHFAGAKRPEAMAMVTHNG